MSENNEHLKYQIQQTLGGITYAGSEFPLMKCAACGQAMGRMGRMGWYHDDDPVTEDSA